MKTKRYLLISILMLSINCLAQKNAAIIDEFAQKVLRAAPMVSSVSLAVVVDDQPILVKGYGYADPKKRQVSAGQTSYYIASITKSFTGLLALLLQEEGLLNLDTPLIVYKPFAAMQNKELFREVTIRKLLNHTSGLDNGILVEKDAYVGGDKSRKVMEMILEETTAKRKEGQTFLYDNLGYNIFDILLKAELDIDWRDLLQKRIFKPLGMIHSSAYISTAESEKWEMAWPYISGPNKVPQRSYLMKNDAMMQAAGGILCSAEDAAKWIEVFLNKGVLDDQQIYKSSLIDEALNPTVAYSRLSGDIFEDKGYGVGWITADFKGEKVNYHFGGYNGFFSHISIMPEHKFGVAAFSNDSYFGDNVSNLIASFAYDYLLGNINSPEQYSDKIDALKMRITRVQKESAEYQQKLLNRKWKLTLPLQAYTGIFESKYLGKIHVKAIDNKLNVSIEALKAVATPYVKKNSIRVDFAGGGTWIVFDVKKGRVVGMNVSGLYFDKI